jgi:hypothetical protein
MVFGIALFLPSCGGGSGGGGGGGGSNPSPHISSLAPTQVVEGSSGQSLTINGSGFIPSSSVLYNGAAHSATYLNASMMGMPLLTADVANVGPYSVVVSNPAPGGGQSSPATMNVVTGTPTGSFSVTVTATSGALTHTTTFTLIVQ